MQKYAARVILGDLNFQLSSDNMFDTLGWKTIDKRIKEKRLTMIYKSLNGLAPEYLRGLFQFTKDTHTYGPRSSTSNGLFITGGKTEYH